MNDTVKQIFCYPLFIRAVTGFFKQVADATIDESHLMHLYTETGKVDNVKIFCFRYISIFLCVDLIFESLKWITRFFGIIL